jgi:response regulator RpfG family c-di-GMP phosphodiesterase
MLPELLQYRGQYSPEQRLAMQQHTVQGFEMFRTSPSKSLQLGALIAQSHHEKFDGSGYPNGLAGQAIPLAARMVAVADVFDAMTSERPYRPAASMDEALEYLYTQVGQHFDPDCVAAFADDWREICAIADRFSDNPPAQH